LVTQTKFYTPHIDGLGGGGGLSATLAQQGNDSVLRQIHRLQSEGALPTTVEQHVARGESRRQRESGKREGLHVPDLGKNPTNIREDRAFQPDQGMREDSTGDELIFTGPTREATGVVAAQQTLFTCSHTDCRPARFGRVQADGAGQAMACKSTGNNIKPILSDAGVSGCRE